ncbi:MAG: GTP-binding protein [Ideonella sp. MAG2]|nr:MAG: GTP-binding protein [Ideonella sp. MAG2]
MERRILVVGPVGAGKTTAIRAVSDIAVVDTDVRASDAVAMMKPTTTVAMDMGIMNVGEGDRVVLYGAPGQDRFDFMWDILLTQIDGVLLLLNHQAPDPLGDLRRYLDAIRIRDTRGRPLVVGVAHVDSAPSDSLESYQSVFSAAQRACGCVRCCPPIQALDARVPQDVRTVLMALAALLEFGQRQGARRCQLQTETGSRA